MAYWGSKQPTGSPNQTSGSDEVFNSPVSSRMQRFETKNDLNIPESPGNSPAMPKKPAAIPLCDSVSPQKSPQQEHQATSASDESSTSTGLPQKQRASSLGLSKNGRFGSIENASFENDRGVTKAVDTESGASVIIKWITAKGPKYIKAAEEEAQKLRDLSAQCQFIVKFIDFLPKVRPDWWEWSILSFIVMEFCPGGSLKDWVDARKAQGRRTTVKEATVIGTQIALALSFCHSRKIAHLDVKPANVMMMSDGYTIKLGDFGISSLLDTVRDTITTKGLQGIVEHTLLYITPGNF
ncbi:Oidioi.mRNA.OKI2018_I69.PAR.g10013.t1.cds [Oikopleura dioica]|uniref:Oidioi.mRNA.OKI2018_I69.PAR.g10013.t1.cds n=1 Tax=Oikopleura dioica TaxID=34765 RepID=A0ABN7RNI9_OIKDI|nr:Oidioi.mRNA.OKI2018_I69.PAR.g10013.t1.cds [Oikopleura dioica]